MSAPIYDVIVIGLGAMGSSAVYQLSKRSVRALGIDQYHPPHEWGSTHGETRITRQAIGEGEIYTRLSLRTYEIFQEIEKTTQKKLLTMTGGLILSSHGSVSKAHVSGFFNNTVAAAKKYGIAHELLDSAQIRKRFPAFQIENNEFGYFENNAGILYPETCVQTQLELAREQGVTLKMNEAVQSVESLGPSGVEVITSKGKYRAKKVILTAGPWIHSFLPSSLQNYFKIHRQVLYWFKPKDPQKFALGLFPIFIWELKNKNQGIYGFPCLDSSSGVKIATEQYLDTTSPEQAVRQVSEKETQEMFQEFVAPYFPELTSHCIQSKVCLYTCTPQARFVIQPLEPSHQDIWFVSACSGHGFKHSAAIGEFAAEIALENPHRYDLKDFFIQ